MSAGSLFGYRRVGRALELHLDGRALAKMRREAGYSAFKALRLLREDMGVIADRVRRGELKGVTEIKGTSLMGEAGGALGFEVRPLPRNLGNAFKQYFFAGLDAIYHPRGLRERATRRWPAETSMTVESLLTRYPERSARSTVAR